MNTIRLSLCLCALSFSLLHGMDSSATEDLSTITSAEEYLEIVSDFITQHSNNMVKDFAHFVKNQDPSHQQFEQQFSLFASDIQHLYASCHQESITAHTMILKKKYDQPQLVARPATAPHRQPKIISPRKRAQSSLVPSPRHLWDAPTMRTSRRGNLTTHKPASSKWVRLSRNEINTKINGDLTTIQAAMDQRAQATIAQLYAQFSRIIHKRNAKKEFNKKYEWLNHGLNIHTQSNNDLTTVHSSYQLGASACLQHRALCRENNTVSRPEDNKK